LQGITTKNLAILTNSEGRFTFAPEQNLLWCKEPNLHYYDQQINFCSANLRI